MQARFQRLARLVGVSILAAGLLSISGSPPAVLAQPTCRGLTPTIVGTAGNDHLVGTSGPDVIAGLAGKDTIEGLAGDDVICGEEDNVANGDDDRIFGGDGDDTLIGEGDGTIGTGGNDRIFGETGNDRILGDAGLGTVNVGGMTICRAVTATTTSRATPASLS
jgi:Ca2+-binding RTX toxin-like protein